MTRVVIILSVMVFVVTVLDPPTVLAQLGPLSIIRSFITNNLAGPKVVHDVQRWEFDPDVAARRRVDFEAKNGVLGEDLIESFGLGEDGRQQERKLQQRARDKAAGYR